jgi:dipeptidyl aminopeptidase/acylaminoacyl peptidase
MKNIFTLLFFVAFTVSNAQENLTYQKPPKEILDLADYERAPSVSMDTKKEFMLLSYRNTYKTLDELSQEEMRLGGLRINPVTNISSATTYTSNLKIGKIKGTTEMQVSGLPENAKITNISWSPNDKKISFSNTTATGVELWIIDVATAQAKRLTDATVNSNMGNPFSWFKDNEHILVRMLPKNRPVLIDNKKDLPTGPTVSTADGSVSQNRTYQDLLKNKTDETNFETLVTSELYKVDLNGNAKLFKEANLYAGETFSPDGNYIMVNTIEKPFSYIVPLSRFPNKSEVYGADGKLVKLVNESPLNEIMPKGFMAVKQGKRSMNWRADAPATLYYAEALDEGNPANKVAFRDEVFTWEAPFTAAPKSFVKTVQRYGGITWGNAILEMRKRT